jgi:hypothetical protein
MSQMFLNVVSTFKGDGLSAATRQLGQFGSAANGLGSTLGKVGAALATFGIAAKAVSFTKDAIDEAKNLQQNLFSLELVFGSLAPEMQNFAKNAASIGLSQAEAAKASVFLGSVLKQSGFGIVDVADKTQTLVGLATDLALVYNYDVSEALMGMTALFRGEYDPIEKFGVAMKQSEINAVLTAKKLNHLTGEQRRLAEQTIRYDLLMQRVTDSLGAFGASSGNLAAETLKLSAEFKNMQSNVGTALVPTVTDLVIALKPLVEQLTPRLIKVLQDSKPAIETFTQLIKDAGDSSTTTGQTVGALATSLGTVFRILAENLGLLIQLAALLAAVRVAVVLWSAALALTPLGAVALGITAVGGTLLVAIDRFKEVNKQLDITNPALSDAAKNTVALKESMDVLKVVLGPVYTLFSNLTDSVFAYIMQLQGIPTDIKTKVTIQTDYIDGAERRRRLEADLAGAAAGTGAGALPAVETAGSAVSKQIATVSSVLKKEGVLATRESKLLGAGVSAGFADLIVSTAKTKKAFQKELAKVSSPEGLQKQQAKFNKTAAGIAELAAAASAAAAELAAAQEATARAAQESADREAAALAERERIYSSFLDSVKSTFASIKSAIVGAFDITELGGSTNAIIRNMNKLLSKVRDFSKNISQLATMGLDPALLQQVIQAGPMAGARLASALVAGGAGALGQINAGFGQIGSLASEIATVGTQSLFGQGKQETIYNINVSGGVGSGATIGKAIVDAIKDYERTSGAVWQGA